MSNINELKKEQENLKKRLENLNFQIIKAKIEKIKNGEELDKSDNLTAEEVKLFYDYLKKEVYSNNNDFMNNITLEASDYGINGNKTKSYNNNSYVIKLSDDKYLKITNSKGIVYEGSWGNHIFESFISEVLSGEDTLWSINHQNRDELDDEEKYELPKEVVDLNDLFSTKILDESQLDIEDGAELDSEQLDVLSYEKLQELLVETQKRNETKKEQQRMMMLELVKQAIQEGKELDAKIAEITQDSYMQK